MLFVTSCATIWVELLTSQKETLRGRCGISFLPSLFLHQRRLEEKGMNLYLLLYKWTTHQVSYNRRFGK